MQRKRFTPEEKVKILRLHLIDRESVSDICERYQLHPNVFYNWQKQFFENGAAAFARGRQAAEKKLERENAQLKSKLSHQNEVIAEVTSSKLELKKKLGLI